MPKYWSQCFQTMLLEHLLIVPAGYILYFFFFWKQCYVYRLSLYDLAIYSPGAFNVWSIFCARHNMITCRPILGLKGVQHLWTLFLATLCVFSKNKATLDKLFCESGPKCCKELNNHTLTSVETIDVKLYCIMCKNQYFPCFKP